MNTIQFNLRGERTAEDLYRDTAVINGYQEIIKTTEIFENQESFPENAEGLSQFTQLDGSILYSYEITSEVPNDKTAEVFGKELVDAKFGLEDAELAGEAETTRAKLEYNIQ